MMNRRHFFGTSFGLGIGKAVHAGTPLQLPAPSETNIALNEYERALAGHARLDAFGIPRSWSDVRDGFHPIAPERVVTLSNDIEPWFKGRGFAGTDRLKERIRSGLEARHDRLAEGKLDTILGIMNILTTYYRRPDQFELWSEQCARREALGTTGIGCGVGILHQFQSSKLGFPELVNPPADWWVFLFPEGIDWASLDDKPLYLLIGAIFSDQFAPSLGLPIWAEIQWCLGELVEQTTSADQWGSSVAKRAREIAETDRVSAARTLNRCVVKSLLKEHPGRSVRVK